MVAAQRRLLEETPSQSAPVARPAERKTRARAPTAEPQTSRSSLAPSFELVSAADRPYGPPSITIPGAACRASADRAADCSYARADRRTFPCVSADRSAHSSHGRSAGGAPQRPPRHRLARRLPIIIRRRIILRILRSGRNRNCRKNPSCCATANQQTNHFNSTQLLTRSSHVMAAARGRQWPSSGRPLLPVRSAGLSGAR